MDSQFNSAPSRGIGIRMFPIGFRSYERFFSHDFPGGAYELAAENIGLRKPHESHKTWPGDSRHAWWSFCLCGQFLVGNSGVSVRPCASNRRSEKCSRLK
jgi:hypothetical protein